MKGEEEGEGEVAREWRVPEGLCTRLWERTERPIIVWGTVFDANSLGKWIYDWTIFCHGVKSAVAELAADLWLLLISLMTREKVVRENRTGKRSKTAEGIAVGLQALWTELERIVERCARSMGRAMKKKVTGEAYFDRKGGIAFVERMFGRDEQLNATEDLMNEIRKWKREGDDVCKAALMAKNGE